MGGGSKGEMIGAVVESLEQQEEGEAGLGFYREIAQAPQPGVQEFPPPQIKPGGCVVNYRLGWFV